MHQTRRAGDSCTCEILVHLTHHLVKGTAAAVEHVMALDLALDKVEHQMRRLHERRVRRGNRAGATRVDGAANGVGRRRPASSTTSTTDEPTTPGPTIVKTQAVRGEADDIPKRPRSRWSCSATTSSCSATPSPSNAAVLYRRRDGALGLIEVTG